MKARLSLLVAAASVAGCAAFEPQPSTSCSERFRIEEPRWKKEWRENLEKPSAVKSALWLAANIWGTAAEKRQ